MHVGSASLRYAARECQMRPWATGSDVRWLCVALVVGGDDSGRAARREMHEMAVKGDEYNGRKIQPDACEKTRATGRTESRRSSVSTRLDTAVCASVECKIEGQGQSVRLISRERLRHPATPLVRSLRRLNVRCVSTAAQLKIRPGAQSLPRFARGAAT